MLGEYGDGKERPGSWRYRKVSGDKKLREDMDNGEKVVGSMPQVSSEGVGNGGGGSGGWDA